MGRACYGITAMKTALVLALGLAGSACLVPADDAGDTAPGEPEPVAETTAALTNPEPTTGAPDPSEWMSRNVPIWNAYIGGLGKDSKRSHPDDNDLYAPIIFVRAGDEDAPKKWLEFRLWYHWMMGDAYFEKLVECGLVSSLDLLSMRAALQDHKDQKTSPPSIFTLSAATPDAVLALDQRSRSACPGNAAPKPFKTLYEGRGDFNPLPGIIAGPNSDHLGPGPSAGRGGSSLPKGVTPPPKGKPSRNDPPQTSLLDQKNGVFRGAPKPIPFSNPTYDPRLGEKEETFRCNGTIYRGFKHGCVDFWNDSTTRKWDQKMGAFTENYFSMKSGACVAMCKTAAWTPATLGWICSYTGAKAIAGVPCAFVGLFTALLSAKLSDSSFSAWCAENWCPTEPPIVSRHDCETNPDGKSMTCKKVQ